MSETPELKKIKKEYGERFMHMCRELFPTMLDEELLYELLSSSFSENCKKSLYDDLNDSNLKEQFKNYLYNKANLKKPLIVTKESKSPYELLKEVGYDLFECNCEKDIQKFKQYYAPNEELCTFKGGRLDKCVVFFAVKKDAEKIKRDNFKNPKREDEYGTSVISIQFNKTGICTVSIKNRYNHSVNNPDATFGNDLDRINPGLRQSFANLLFKRGLELDSSNVEGFEIPYYIVANDGKYYKYNMEIDQIYYCPNNMVIEYGKPKKLEKTESQILADYFIIDTKNKTIKPYSDRIRDCFIDDLQNIERIDIKKDDTIKKGTREILIHKRNNETPIVIKIDKDNQIIGYSNENLKHVGDRFLYCNKKMEELLLPNITTIGSDFLESNNALCKLELNNVTNINNDFLYWNRSLKQIELTNLIEVNYGFLRSNESITQLELPNLIKIGNDCLNHNIYITKFIAPKLKVIGDRFMFRNRDLNQFIAPNLEEVGNNFLYSNKAITELNLPSLNDNNGNLSLGFFDSNPKIAKKVIKAIKKNEKNKNSTKKINSMNIAELDKQASLTKVELDFVNRVIEKFKNIARKINKKER